MTTKKIEIVILNQYNGWDTEVVEVPIAVADSESQDAFLAWVYSDEGSLVRRSWQGWFEDTAAVFVWSWHNALKEEEE